MITGHENRSLLRFQILGIVRHPIFKWNLSFYGMQIRTELSDPQSLPFSFREYSYECRGGNDPNPMGGESLETMGGIR
jgi:hypothetical protein